MCEGQNVSFRYLFAFKIRNRYLYQNSYDLSFNMLQRGMSKNLFQKCFKFAPINGGTEKMKHVLSYLRKNTAISKIPGFNVMNINALKLV